MILRYFLLTIVFTISLGAVHRGNLIIYKATYSKGFIGQSKKFDNNRISYTLEFNNHKSKFFVTKDSDLKLIEATVFSGTNTYYNRVRDSSIYYTPKSTVFPEKYLIEQKYDDLDWHITSETKIVNGYNCYKAFKYQTALDFNKAENEPLFIAWFAPKLNFKHGPADGVGLPGLVLEYSFKNFIYKIEELEKIELKTSESLSELDPPSDTEIISLKQYSKRVIKWYKSLKS